MPFALIKSLAISCISFCFDKVSLIKSGKLIINDLLSREYYDHYKNVDKWEEDKAIMTAVQISSQLKDPYFKKNLVTLATYDSNMEIRDTAIKILKNIYNVEISNG